MALNHIKCSFKNLPPGCISVPIFQDFLLELKNPERYLRVSSLETLQMVLYYAYVFRQMPAYH